VQGDVDARALAAAIDTIARFVASFDPHRYSGEDAASLVGTFIKGERHCVAGRTVAATRAAAAHPHVATGQKSPAHWLAELTGESVGHAVDILRLGETIEEHPAVEEAYRRGRLSPTGVKAIAGAVKVNPDREGDLLQAAEQGSLSQLKAQCLRAKAEKQSAEDAAQAYAAIRTARFCRFWTGADGSFRLDALMTPDAGAALWAAVNAEGNRIFQRARKAGHREKVHNYRADALLALVTGQGIIGASGDRRDPVAIAPPSVEDPRSADPSSDLQAGRDAAHPPGDGGTSLAIDGAKRREGTIGGDPEKRRSSPPVGNDTLPEAGWESVHSAEPAVRHPDPKAVVHLRVDLEALRRGRLGRGQKCEIPGVGPVSLEVAHRLMGEALLKLVITDGIDVTTVCHLGRSVPAALRTALEERDPCCVVPGCESTAGLEMDHWDVSFAEGGAVSMANLARLCHHHHYLRTHQGFALAGGPGQWTWTPPSPERAGPTEPSDGPTGRFPMAGTDGDPDPPLFVLEE
jgi:hypothetical protein